MPASRFRFGRFVLDTGRAGLARDGTPVALGHRGFRLLHALLKARGEVVTKDELIDAAWPGAVVEESNLSVQIAALRKLLGKAPDGADWIATVSRIGYRFAAQVAEEEPTASRPAPLEPAEPSRKPSLVVLPLANLSEDRQQEYFADGVTEDIITALSRFRWFSVIARNSSFAFRGRAIDATEFARELDARYLLEGSIRRSGTHVRISVQLVNASSAQHLWADRYDVDLGDLLGLQDRIAAQVAGAIEPELLKSESATAARRRRSGNSSALDLVYQGAWYFHRVTLPTHRRARDFFRQALELDSELPEANVWLARVSAGLVAYGWTDDPDGDLREGVEAAFTAIQFDEQSPYAHYALAITSCYAGALDRAIRAAETAVELSPSFALGHLVLGMARLYSGLAAEAIEPLGHGLRLNPFDPQNFVWYRLLSLAHLFAEDLPGARDSAVRALKVRPNWRPTVEYLAGLHAALGDTRAACECVDELAKLDTPPGDVLAPLKLRHPGWAEQLSTLLRRAGVENSSSRRG